MSEGNYKGENQRIDLSEEIKLNSGAGSTNSTGPTSLSGDTGSTGSTGGASNADKILEEIQSLRNSVDILKKTIEPTAPENTAPSDKVVKILKENESGTAVKPSEDSSFVAKYREQMKQQMANQDPKAEKRTERIAQKDAARREKEHQRELIRQQREALRKEKEQQRLLRAQKRAEQRQRKIEEDEARKKERRARAKELQKKREIRAEVKRQKKLAARTAKLGGGVVETYDTQISTEIKPIARYSIRDLLGIDLRRKLREAKIEEERESIRQEHEAKTAEARQAAAHLRMVRRSNFKSTAIGRFLGSIFAFSERHKGQLIFAMSVILIICVAVAGYFNYYTLYEYSYNGKALGYVKNKDDVYRITDLVQNELSTDDVKVVIDEDDISFKRMSTRKASGKSAKDIVADTSDEVLRRLTYMGDLNVKAWVMYVNNRRVGSLQEKEMGADVLKKLEERYFSGKKGAEIEKAEIQEDIEIKRENAELRNVMNEDEMVERLCTVGEKESNYTTLEGDTLADIAALYGITEKQILKDNPDLDPTKLTAGVNIVIKQKAPPVTIRITEKREYAHTIEYKTIEKKTDEMYEGEEEVEQEGEDGKEELTERYVSINGEIDEENKEILKRDVKKKAVDKIVTIGTAERPPSVGDGVFIWPIESGYTLTSRFGHRWGRLHAGIDLGTRIGNDVLAADGGIVTRSGYYGGYGLCVDVDHQNGMSTRYGHLSQSLVSVGDEVYEGQHIAESGNSGFSTGAHLHFEIHVNGSATDPLNYLP